MKMVCSNCDLGLKRSDCSEDEYIDCECRRWNDMKFTGSKADNIIQFIEEYLDLDLLEYQKELIKTWYKDDDKK